jgi:hypothetical protein
MPDVVELQLMSKSLKEWQERWRKLQNKQNLASHGCVMMRFYCVGFQSELGANHGPIMKKLRVALIGKYLVVAS